MFAIGNEEGIIVITQVFHFRAGLNSTLNICSAEKGLPSFVRPCTTIFIGPISSLGKVIFGDLSFRMISQLIQSHFLLIKKSFNEFLSLIFNVFIILAIGDVLDVCNSLLSAPFWNKSFLMTDKLISDSIRLLDSSNTPTAKLKISLCLPLSWTLRSVHS